MNPTVFKIKMEHWLDSSNYIRAHKSELSHPEIAAADFLMDAWRDHDFSTRLVNEAKVQIDTLVQNDELHGNHPELKTNVQRFRGVAANIYTTDAETYEQFRTELRLRFGVNAPSGTPKPKDVPPPPPPPSGRAELTVTQAEIDIMSVRGSVMQSGCTSIPEGTAYLRPRVEYTTTVVGSRWKITCRLVEASGKELRIIAKDCLATSAHGTFDLDTFDECSTLSPGNYRLLVYVNGELRSDRQFTVNPAVRTPKETVDIQIQDIVSCDSSGNVTATEIQTTAQFIAPVIRLSSTSDNNLTEKLRIGIYDPKGNLMHNESSPAGLTYSETVSFKRTGDFTLRPWGDTYGRYYAQEGRWRIDILLEDGTLTSRSFEIKRPRSKSPVISIHDVDFFLNASGREDKRKNYEPAPRPGDETVCPRIHFTPNAAVNVVEISYAIYAETAPGMMRKIFATPPTNYLIDSAKDKLLDVGHLQNTPFAPGTYGISFTVNGIETPIHKFEVKRSQSVHWGAVAAVTFTIISFILGLFVF